MLDQVHRIHGLLIVRTTITCGNGYRANAMAALRAEVDDILNELLRCLAPLGWDQRNLLERYQFRISVS